MTESKYYKLTKDYLFEELVKNKLKVAELANHLNIPKYMINLWCRQYNLDIRHERILYHKHGHLKAIYRTERKSTDGHRYYLCECDCGSGCEVVSNALATNYTISCGCSNFNNRTKGNSHPSWRGFGEIYGYVFSIIKDSAKERNLDFQITIEYIWDLFLKQNRRCLFTGIELVFADSVNRQCRTASLDRIDSSKGYIEGNVQWVHKIVNIMKSNMTEKEFLEWIASIYKYRLEGKNLWKEIGVKF